MSTYLISVEALAKQAKENLIIIDCRFSLADVAMGERLYQQSHIEGAHYFHLDRDMSSPVAEHGGRHPLPSVEDLQQKLRAVGVSSNSLVVVYDDQRFAFAARLWWLLRYLGHEQVKVLDGGFKAWQQAGMACSDAVPSVSEGDFVAQPQASLVVNRQQVIDRSAQAVLIDAREAPRYQGLEEPIDPIAGHIEGAVNYPWQAVTDAEGFWDSNYQPWDSLLKGQEAIVYCGSGVTACVNLLSLAEAGCNEAKLYAGSWSDWCSYL